MLFSLSAHNWFLSLIGINHTVEILQSYVFFYFLFGSCMVLLLNWTSDLKRFFFFSELAWLALMALFLTIGSKSNFNPVHANAFFILIFTACEAVTLACLLLVNVESRKRRNKIKF